MKKPKMKQLMLEFDRCRREYDQEAVYEAIRFGDMMTEKDLSTAVTTRLFDTGATRDTATGKFEYAKYLSPFFINGFGRYMNRHQTMADGTKRAGDNWKQGFPDDVLLESFFRHAMDVWMLMKDVDLTDERGERVDLNDAIMGAVFNLQALYHQRAEKLPVKRGA